MTPHMLTLVKRESR